MKILIAGDTHGNLSHFRRCLVEAAAEEDVELIIQVGDFGFMWNRNGTYLYRLDRILEETGLTLWWLDGNHENFDELRKKGATPDDRSTTVLTDRILYLPRGHRFELDGCRFMAFGGAVSIDQHQRREGVSWWPQETITAEQVARVTAEPVDVLLTHDGPEIPGQLWGFLQRFGSAGHKMDAASLVNRQYVRDVFDRVTPKLVVHGHYHYRYTDQLEQATVIGLDRDETGPNSYVVIDTDMYRSQ